MPRRAKDPNHPLERLRRQLSTPSFYMTRAYLAERAGVAEVTLRDIELGKFRLRGNVAMKVGYATNADPVSLLRGDDPIRDFEGNPLTANSPKDIAPSTALIGGLKQLFEAAMETAMEKPVETDKPVGFLIAYSFANWLEETFQTYGLSALLTEKLTERLGSFDPEGIPDAFRPKNPKLAAEWKKFEQEIDEELSRCREEVIEECQRKGLQPFDEQIINVVMTLYRPKAIENVRQRRANAEKQQSPSPVRKAVRSTRT